MRLFRSHASIVLLAITLCGLAGGGCVQTQTSANLLAPEGTYPPHDRPVYVTKDSLGDLPYAVIGTVEAQYQYYGAPDECYPAMAKRGRQIGADAIVNVTISYRPSLPAWAAPHAHGVAVKFKSPPPDLTPRGVKAY